MSDSFTFVKNSILTLSRQIIGILLSMGTVMIIARYLGPRDQGSYSLIILLPTMLVTFLNLGVGVSSVYYIGKKETDLKTVFKTNIYSGLLVSIVAMFIGAAVVLLAPDKLFSGIPTILLLAILLLLPILILIQFLQPIFQGLQDFKAFNTIILIGQGTTLFLVAIFLVVLKAGLGFALIAYSVGQILTLATILILLQKKLSINFLTGKFSKAYLNKSIAYGVKAYLSNVLSFINYRADMFIISFFLNPVAVGLYAVAVSIAEKLWVFSEAVSSVLFPKISSLTDEKSRSQLTSIISRNVMALSVLMGLVMLVVSGFIIHLLFGDKYAASSMALILLLPGIVLGAESKIVSNDFSGRGKPEINLYTSILSVILNIFFNIILVPRYGINGASIATSISYGLTWLVKIIIFKKITGQSYTSFLIISKQDFMLYKKLLLKVKKGV